MIIVVDTLRADHLSVYGYPRNTTPNLERLAQQGALFENAFSTSAWTLPGHASILTGLYPHEHGAEMVKYDGRYPTLPQVLGRLGYRTGAFSANLNFFTREQGFGQGFLHFEDFFQTATDMFVRTFYGRQLTQFLQDTLGLEDIPERRRARDINRAALRWIQRQPGRPFFAMLNYFDTHDPYLPPEPYGARFSTGKRPAAAINGFAGRFHPQLTPEQLQQEIDAYDGAITYADDQIAWLLSKLKAQGYGENTLVVVTSDHGESLGDHGLINHRNALYPELTHVPLILWWPGHVPAGLRLGTPVSNVELAATLMELSGHGDQGPFPGPSLAQLWEAPETQAHWPFLLAELAKELYDQQNPAYLGWAKCLVTPTWYYIVHQSLPPELYAWTKDRGTLQNLAATPEGVEVVRQLQTELAFMLSPRHVAGLTDSREGKPKNIPQ